MSRAAVGEELNASSSDRLERQALEDLDRRSVIGSVAYLLLWVGIATSTGVAAAWTVPTLATTAGFALITAARIVLHIRVPRIADDGVAGALLLFRLLVLAGVLLFSLLTAGTLYLPVLAPARDPMALTGGVMCAAATLTLGIDRWLRFGVPAILLGSYLIALLARPSAQHLTVAFAVVVYFVYVVVSAGNVYADFWAAKRSALLLEQRAAELERLSNTDGLTQLANRRHFDQRLLQEWHRAIRSRQPVALLLVDIDHFKRLNDEHGHPVGDECLKVVAATLRAGARGHADLVARYGGEEFAVILAGTTAASAHIVAERLRHSIAGLRVATGPQSVRMTISIGVAAAQPSNSEQQAGHIIALADRALYAAKARGRNQVVTARGE